MNTKFKHSNFVRVTAEGFYQGCFGYLVDYKIVFGFNPQNAKIDYLVRLNANGFLEKEIWVSEEDLSDGKQKDSPDLSLGDL